MEKYFGTDGIRGKAEMFTADFLYKIVRGLGVRDKKVMIGGDTRESTERILGDLARAISAEGGEVVNVSVLATPAINFAFYQLGADYAIDVTASHNPYTDNGIKIFERGEKCGVKLGAEKREVVERALNDNSLAMPEDANGAGRTESAVELYEKHLLDYLGNVDLGGLKVALDCANGATSVVGGVAFEKLGAEATVINNDANFGQKINAGVGSTHIEGLQKVVREGEFNLGAAFDGDGDRCMLVDERGEVVDGDQILAILAEYWGLDKVAGTVMSNQGLLNWGRERGVEVVTTDVGDQNVAKAMMEQNIKVGGEQSGHIILPNEAMGDGMLTALVVAKIMSEKKQSLNALASTMKKTPQVMINVEADKSEKARLGDAEVQELLAEFSSRLEPVHGRLLVRPSGTEALVRVTLWGDSEVKIAELGEELVNKLKEKIENGRS